ncbi:steroid 17-alpha-hydroxylase/17,20 lyase isoform X1 [Biomphalaria glabrata]|nr:steroid 17-alpha-hydroxylase/17,20 lyase isoform X1 [Biomphalaria glabrata]
MDLDWSPTTFYLLYSCVALAVTFLFHTILSMKSRKLNLPPGPRGLSCIVQLLRASWNESVPELAFTWAKTYGPIMYFNAGGTKFCYLNTPELSRLVLAGEDYRALTSDRVGNFVSKFTWYDGKDLFFTKFDVIQRKKRKLFHRGVALYGDGVEKFEAIVGGELDLVLEHLDKMASTGQDVQMDQVLSEALKNILVILINGEKPSCPEDADAIVEYDLAVNKLASEDIHLVLMAAPWMRYLPGRYKRACDKVVETREKAERIMFSKMKETFDPKNLRGLTDVFLKSREEPGYEFLKDDQHIKGVLTMLFFAAHLTSRATLLNTFLILLHHPDVTANIQDEIDRVLGDRPAKVEDRQIMHYTEAVILEVLRYTTFFPLICIRNVKTDLKVENYDIPKDTLIISNIGYFHRDPKYWDDPWSFKPERFLDAKGQILPADHSVRKNLLSFGIGNRMCPGEVFARSRVFLFVTRILQRYDVMPPNSEPLVSCHPDNRVKMLVRQTPPFRCQLVPRGSPN